MPFGDVAHQANHTYNLALRVEVRGESAGFPNIAASRRMHANQNIRDIHYFALQCSFKHFFNPAFTERGEHFRRRFPEKFHCRFAGQPFHEWIEYLVAQFGVVNNDALSGALHQLATLSTLPEGFKGANDTAEIEVHPSGKFLYGSNRGHDSIALFAIELATGVHKFVESVSTNGKTPRNFEIDPTGAYLFAANQKSDNVVIFKIDQQTGHLTPTGQVLEVPSPVCVKFVAIR